MSSKEVFSFDQLEQKETDEVIYDVVEAHGGLIRIGSLTAGDLIEWMEANEDPAKKREAGLRLLVKSLVGPEEAGSPRVPKERFDALLASFRNKSAKGNGKVINAALKLNGIATKDDAKNESGEAATAASPSDSRVH